MSTALIDIADAAREVYPNGHAPEPPARWMLPRPAFEKPDPQERLL